MGLLSRDRDRPSGNEEAAIGRLEDRRVSSLLEIDTAIKRAHLRQQVYLARGELRDAEIQQDVKDRRLDERRAIMGLVGRHG